VVNGGISDVPDMCQLSVKNHQNSSKLVVIGTSGMVNKKPAFLVGKRAFILVAGTGFEPLTFRL